jgi:hypothetical protein
MRKLLLSLMLVSLLVAPALAERLTVTGFAGEALDQLQGNTSNGFTGGIVLDYQVSDRFTLGINTYHSTRQVENSLSDILFDGSSLEWQAKGTYAVAQMNEGETDFNVVVSAGFYNLLDSERADLLDNHLVGVGITHKGGTFGGSSIVAGYGVSDTFAAHQKSRFKVRANLLMSELSLPLDAGVILSGDLDSDLRSGTDGVRIILATMIPLGKLLQ